MYRIQNQSDLFMDLVRQLVWKFQSCNRMQTLAIAFLSRSIDAAVFGNVLI
jgi:hypothetical protein